MNRSAILLGITLAFLAPPLGAAAQEHQHGQGELGSVSFPVTCNAEAQKRMNSAVAMLHSFWFPEARRTFESVVEADPGCGAAYWGAALTYFGNPMGGGNAPDQQAAGWQAAERAASIGARNEHDRAYIEAALVLFRGHDKLDNRARARSYEQALQSIVDRYPDDQEARIFHAIFMVANAPPLDLTFAQQKRAAEVLTRMYREQPNHPGLAHYIIHAFDSPPLAPQALEAARRYAGIAPAAPHALHMPSHIFTRLGYWDESIRTNRRSADLETTPGGKSHPLDYLVYAYLQRGRDELALAALQEIGGSSAGDYIAGTLSNYNAAAMPARYALERDDWKAAADLKVIPGQATAEAVTHFARGLGAARAGNVQGAQQEVDALAGIVSRLRAQNDPYWPVVIEAQRMASTAWVAHLEGRHGDALRIARAAADQEETVEKHPVTPGPLIPARELLGDILLVHQQPAAALEAYEKTLEHEPNRLRTLVGAARAAKAAGRNDAARKYYQAIVELVDPGSKRAELNEARMFVRSGP